jgi:antitoxin HicB
MTLAYHVELAPDDNGTLLATCPALPEVTTFGEDEADALRHARDAIEEALAARVADGQDIPYGSKGAPAVALPAQTALKILLYRTLCREGIPRAELARRLAWNRESVDRLFRLDHNSKLDQIEAAFSAMGLRIVVRLKEQA